MLSVQVSPFFVPTRTYLQSGESISVQNWNCLQSGQDH